MTAPAAFHLLVKPGGALCNLDCKYCFYLSKEELYPGSRFRMSDSVLENYIRQYLRSQKVPEATLAWQGGEPTLMGLDFFRRSVEMAERHRRPGQRVRYTLQTNGVLLNDEWCRFFRAHDFLIGLSLDGPREMHDAYRLDKAGRPTFDKVMRALRLLQEHKVEFNILATVHAANSSHPLEVYRFLRDEAGARFLQFIPIVERVGPCQVSERSVRPQAWGQFLMAIFDEWVRRDVGRVFVQSFDAALASWVGAPPGVCLFAETCGDALALEHNGDLYSCDHFVEPGFRLGNIAETSLEEMVASARQRKFGTDKRDTLPGYCRRCEVLFACRGECPKNRFTLTPDGEPGLNYLCPGYRDFFNHIAGPMRIMAELFLRRQPPARIMEILAREPGGDSRQRFPSPAAESL
ncbi:MAG TPA: anaerobic sulfatase maturase [Candidatus Nitrosotenuis sp.]|nr:anaerobic sulfatase maturase [Candidatus Nitrosotenuis sp.]